MSDGTKVTGRLTVLDVPGSTPLFGADLERALADGSARVDFVSMNLLVNNGLSTFSRLLGNNACTPLLGGAGFSTLADITVQTMQLGNTVSPAAPAAADTSGVGSLVFTPTLIVSYPTPYSVMFSGVVPQTELIGTTITEECLRLGNGLVFAKKAPLSILKTAASGKQFNHEVIFARG